MDISSEMIHALLPVYLVTVLGVSALTVGVIEGIAEATANITKIFSGALSDWLGNRKYLTTFGYGLAAFTKPIFPLAPSFGWIVGARFVDRIGKGIREAPRDALLADIAPQHMRGASFGLRQSLDTVGAFVGPLLAIALMWISANQFTTVFWVAVAPAFLAMAFMIFGVEEPAREPAKRQVRAPLSVAELRKLGLAFWMIVGVGTVFTLARFSEAFLILKAKDSGLPTVLVPAVLIVMNVVYAAGAYPVGALSDRGDRMRLLRLGFLFLVFADLLLALSPNLLGAAIGVMLWGLHLAFTQGVLAAMVADATPAELRGTAYGVFSLGTGLALLAASVTAGALWNSFGPRYTFLAGAVFTSLALAGLVIVPKQVGAGTRATSREPNDIPEAQTPGE
jgi:MFS family permease